MWVFPLPGDWRKEESRKGALDSEACFSENACLGVKGGEPGNEQQSKQEMAGAGSPVDKGAP